MIITICSGMYLLSTSSNLSALRPPRQIRTLHKTRSLRALPAQSSQTILQTDGMDSVDTSALLDGPDLFMMRTSGNLGAIQDSLKGQPSDADIKAMQDVPNRATGFDGIYLDAPAIFGSTVLLSVLLFLSLERVLGLDQWLAKAKQRWKEQEADKQKWAVYDARRRLEETFSSSDEAGDD